ncbi:hypothetical protein SY83_17615 [Paenibacillus swuensis]|uniref:DUF3052 domain-containing protein n=1 Tax=Paenibacillus swuensis TaxID=1178515 RepID=A0A172TLZ5_9BACL|nr:DUF3052 domain-containing protein [Paenibacillus swuensis]ANE47803.1 hypothetical protein SY83_17615 [Paenibacillus swuensis]
MSEQDTLKKLNFKDHGQPVLVLNAPQAYAETESAFKGHIHRHPETGIQYDFVQVFGSSNDEIQVLAHTASHHLLEDGLFWLCYPKKTSKLYKGSDCSRETVAGLLSEEGFEPVRQVAIDEDWSALRFRKVDHIKKMTRSFAVTEKGKARIGELND